jgi:amino acid permease
MAENEDGSSLIVNETSEEIESVNDEDESCDDPEADGDLEVLVKTDTECGTRGKTSTLSSTFLIVNAALGAGLLNFSQAFDEAGGILIAMVVQGVLLAFIMVALIILAVTSNVNYSNTLQDVMYTASGVWGRRMTSLIVVLYSFGTCITFLIIIGDQFDRALASFVGPHFCDTWYLDRSFLMPVSVFCGFYTANVLHEKNRLPKICLLLRSLCNGLC